MIEKEKMESLQNELEVYINKESEWMKERL